MTRINSRCHLALTLAVLTVTTGLVIQTAQANPLTRPEAITILVPPPENPVITTAPTHTPPAIPSITAPEGRLTVPKTPIPLGQVGDRIQANQLPPPPLVN